MKIIKADDNRVEIQVSDGIHMTLIARTWAGCDNSPGKYHAATRVYCSWGDAEVTDKDGNVLPSPSYAPRDPETGKATDEDQAAEDKEFRIFNAAEVRVMKRMVQEAHLPLAMLTDTDASWLGKERFSRKAGCSCSCSPGLIMPYALRYDGRPVDVWLRRTHLHRQHEWRLFYESEKDPGASRYDCPLCSDTKARKDLTHTERYKADPEYAARSDAEYEAWQKDNGITQYHAELDASSQRD